jgi:hypothetical protein
LLGIAELDSGLRDAFAPVSCEGLIQVRVWPEEANESGQSKAVSMSWWLSAPVQEHLHNQTESQHAPQSVDNTLHLAAILEQFGARSPCERASKP